METREKQYSRCIDTMNSVGRVPLGLMSSDSWISDPKRLIFTLSRYKFVAKMLEGAGKVAEIGCSDGFASRIVAQSVGSLNIYDFDPVFVQEAEKQINPPFPFQVGLHDILEGPLPQGPYDAVYALDVLEHIPSENEDRFMKNLSDSLVRHGVCLLGMPSLNSQKYASPISLAGHVNCKNQPDFRHLLERYFYNVFMFSMNDEVVHTGFYQMANYIFALGVTPKR